MANKTLTGKRTFKLPVTQAGTMQTKEFELPSDMEVITGIAVTSDRRDLAWQRGELGLIIAGEELIKDGEGADEYIFGSNHPARTFAFGELPITASDRRMRLRYQDNNVSGSAFSAYTVKIVVTFSKRNNR